MNMNIKRSVDKEYIKNLIFEDKDISMVLYDDVLNLNNIIFKFNDENKFFSQEASVFVDENFIKKSNEKTFNGIIYGLKNFELRNSKILFEYEKSEYKVYLATKNKDYKKYIKDNNYFVIPLGVSGIIITKDNKIIVAGKTKFYERNKFVGGFVATEDIKSEQINPFYNMSRESKEEIGNLGLFNGIVIGIVLDNCCTFITQQNTNYTSNEVLEIYKKNNPIDAYEMENMFFLDNSESSIKEMILNSDMSKTGKEGLKLYLKRNFGYK